MNTASRSARLIAAMAFVIASAAAHAQAPTCNQAPGQRYFTAVMFIALGVSTALTEKA